MFSCPINTKHLYNIYTTSAQRLRHWSNVVWILYKCLCLLGVMCTLIFPDCGIFASVFYSVRFHLLAFLLPPMLFFLLCAPLELLALFFHVSCFPAVSTLRVPAAAIISRPAIFHLEPFQSIVISDSLILIWALQRTTQNYRHVVWVREFGLLVR